MFKRRTEERLSLIRRSLELISTRKQKAENTETASGNRTTDQMPSESLMMGLRGSESSRMREYVCVCVWRGRRESLIPDISSFKHWNTAVRVCQCLCTPNPQDKLVVLPLREQDTAVSCRSHCIKLSRTHCLFINNTPASSSLSHWASLNCIYY